MEVLIPDEIFPWISAFSLKSPFRLIIGIPILVSQFKQIMYAKFPQIFVKNPDSFGKNKNITS
jgi:hypothetical protein